MAKVEDKMSKTLRDALNYFQERCAYLNKEPLPPKDENFKYNKDCDSCYLAHTDIFQITMLCFTNSLPKDDISLDDDSMSKLLKIIETCPGKNLDMDDNACKIACGIYIALMEKYKLKIKK